MRCECCAAPLPLPGARPRVCPKCKGFLYARGLKGKTVEMEVTEGGRTGTASFLVDRLETLTAKPLEPSDLLPVELFRCPLCNYGLVLGAVAEPLRDGTAFRLHLPLKRSVEVRCDFCGRPNHAFVPSEEPLVVPVVPLKRSSFDHQVDQFLSQPPPPAAPERSGCLGIFLFFLAHR